MFTILNLLVNTTQPGFTYLILASFGLLIIVICIGAYVFGYGANLRDRVQEIAAFGAQLRISLITFLILVGVLLIVPLVWNQFNDVVHSLADVRKERDEFKLKIEKLTEGQTKEQQLLLELEGINKNGDLNKNDFKVLCFKVGAPEPEMMEFQVVRGRPNKLKIVFPDVKNGVTLPNLEVIHTPDSKRWNIEDLAPTIPTITLKKSENE